MNTHEMKLSEHFTLEEMIASDLAARYDIDNTPPPEIIDNLHRVAVELERVRGLLGVPIIVTSGYRCEALNAMVRSKPKSAHVKGLAVDFKAPDFGTPLAICEALKDYTALAFDQLIYEFGAWVHIGFSEQAPRRQLLTINREGTHAGLQA